MRQFSHWRFYSHHLAHIRVFSALFTNNLRHLTEFYPLFKEDQLKYSIRAVETSVGRRNGTTIVKTVHSVKAQSISKSYSHSFKVLRLIVGFSR